MARRENATCWPLAFLYNMDLTKQTKTLLFGSSGTRDAALCLRGAPRCDARARVPVWSRTLEFPWLHSHGACSARGWGRQNEQSLTVGSAQQSPQMQSQGTSWGRGTAPGLGLLPFHPPLPCEHHSMAPLRSASTVHLEPHSCDLHNTGGC